MTADEIRQKLAPWVRKHTRIAWLPTLQDGETDPRGSRFGGAAWVPEGEAPAACQGCGAPLRLVLQLNLAELPQASLRALPPSGLLQVLYCADEDCAREQEAFSEFSDAHRVQIVPSGAGRLEAGANPFAAKSIVGWEQAEDHPHPEDSHGLGLQVDYDFKERRARFVCPEVGLDAWVPLGELEIETVTQARDGDKLRGWPYWIQSAEYPQCPKCQTAMTHLFQIDSEKGVPYMWGDAGMVQVTYCERHPEVMTMNWACS